jgi:two-component system chemotaxis sensor kinase CheA
VTEKEDSFLQELLTAFRAEADEHVQAIAGGLLELEKADTFERQAPWIETVYREAHSLKGAARAVNRTEIEGICQSIESVFAKWKRGEQRPSAEAIDAIHRSLDALHPLLDGQERPPSGVVPDRPTATATATVEGAVPAPSSETVRVATGKLDKLLSEAEEMLAMKLAAGQRVADLRDAAAWFEPWKKEWSKVQPHLRSLRQATERDEDGDAGRIVEFCDWSQTHIRALESRLDAIGKAAKQDRHDTGRMVDGLLDHSKKLLMLPFSTALAILPKLVRDLCRDQGKEADVILRGGDIEVDKRILEEMKDPLVHLVRNCVDHGLEAPSERARLGKPPRGTVSISIVEAEGNKVGIAVADDGAGISPDRVRESAVRRGLVTGEEARLLGDEEAVSLVFQSDLSTRTTVTALSGRGLGLAIVREKVEKLGGRVSIENAPGRGVTFRILLPLTLATLRGVLVEVAGQVFAIPTRNVERVARLAPDDIRTVENRETVSLGGRVLSLARLESVLELTRGAPPPEAPVVVVLLAAGRQIAFAVDAVRGETEVLLKPLRMPLARVRNVAGATILGTGEVVPVLNVTDLMKSATLVRAPPRPAPPPVAVKRKTVLVVEDSITSRMLLKNILESAGYRVRTAVDGVDALTALKTEDFDAVVSDIEMPRLDGFGLTERIRGDRRLADKPVVLVTARESQADRERGADVGANAYIVKSSFDQSNLLASLERLV